MVYLRKFELLDYKEEDLIRDTRTIYTSYYPIGLFSYKGLKYIEFDKITIFYGGNGSGKSTLLNIIAEKLRASRKNNVLRGTNFDNYVNACKYHMSMDKPVEIKCITSDDVFDSLLDIRAINSKVSRRKEELSKEYLDNRYSESVSSYDSYNDLKTRYESKHSSMSSYVRKRLANNNIVQNSNGEEALMFWEKEIDEESIYILDEPENSLSAENQLKLKQFIEESVRFYNCQFIISTHSPFLLNLMDAKIYDLDENPVKTKKWTELSNVRLYYDFFKERKEEFEEK